MVSREATYYRVTAKYIDLSIYRLITGLYLGYIQDIAELAPLLSRAKSTGGSADFGLLKGRFSAPF